MNSLSHEDKPAEIQFVFPRAIAANAANGCASVSPVIKLYLSFHQGDRRRGQMTGGGDGGRWREHQGGEVEMRDAHRRERDNGAHASCM